jgi:FtsP/CotA-like multicopper oxidase with cupredoxin domain
MATARRTSCAWLLASALVALAAPGWAQGPQATHSGTVQALDRSAGTIVLDEVGPWKVKDGETVITRQTFAVTSTTQFVRVKRATEAGAAEWARDFVESPLAAWQVKEGDFVTITVKRDGPRATAARITVIETGEP